MSPFNEENINCPLNKCVLDYCYMELTGTGVLQSQLHINPAFKNLGSMAEAETRLVIILR